ncbi:hypothetical protein BAUCODRAFT_33901 [Baudoinia panamericana UAMH 10762]|uniref:Uncharacterized protein n=1 Tax=Baudoinia panamericana (strain UAMH 10762) TaxID=717646 RepID=M2MY97_BAUPA|nr:uncharacterized protein BAUCODRAFT_33901 [Baudoinia panamericana UAMH 10762]EMC96533.1 hypothetical protein BAUCODRAFT_33901 [Baudoinia panamericana UAMH 10762]
MDQDKRGEHRKHFPERPRTSEPPAYAPIPHVVASSRAHTVECTFNIREQILANARALWPIAERQHGSIEHHKSFIPYFELVIYGDLPKIRAEVVWCYNDVDASVGQKFMFLTTPDAGSAEEALSLLLRLCMALISRYRAGFFFYETGTTYRTVGSLGGWYEPTADCGRFVSKKLKK